MRRAGRVDNLDRSCAIATLHLDKAIAGVCAGCAEVVEGLTPHRQRPLIHITLKLMVPALVLWMCGPTKESLSKTGPRSAGCASKIRDMVPEMAYDPSIAELTQGLGG